MKTLKLNFIAMILLAAVSLLNAREMGVVIAGKDVSVQELSKTELANIFLGKKTNWEDGTRIMIGYMMTPAETVDGFFDEVVGRSHRRFKKYWVKKVFAGYGIAPKLFKNMEKALEFIEQNAGCIAFVTVSDIRELGDAKVVSITGKTGF